MSSKRFLICMVVSMLILALFGLTACGDSSLGGSDEDGEKVSISGGVDLVNTTIDAAKDSDGILISYSFSFKENGIEQTSIATFGANGEKYYFLSDVGNEYIYDLSGSTGMDMYTKEKGETLWTKTSTPYTETSKEDAQEIIDVTYEEFVAFMTSYSLYSAYDTGLVKAGTEQIAGHTCTKYQYTVSLYGVSMTTIYCVEESSGICFKVAYEGNSDDVDAAVSMVLTEYKDTYTVNIPTASQIVEEDYCEHIDEDGDDYCDLCGEFCAA